MKLGALGLPAYRTFFLEELKEATNNFDESSLIEGSHGQVMPFFFLLTPIVFLIYLTSMKLPYLKVGLNRSPFLAESSMD